MKKYILDVFFSAFFCRDSQDFNPKYIEKSIKICGGEEKIA